MKYLKYILGILVVIVPCVITVLIYNDKITENSPQYYKQGVEFYEKGDYSNAYYNFGKISKISPLYAMSLYKQAKSAQKAGDYKMAAYKYDLFLQKVPNSVFTTTATLNLGKSYFYSKQYDEAQKVFEKIKNKTKNDGTEEEYYLGLIAKEKSESQKAARYLINYLKSALSDEGLNTKYILNTAEELSTYTKILNDEEKKTLGIAYFKNAKYAKALEYFSKLPVNMCWDYLVLANHYSGNKVIAKKLIETGFKSFGKNAQKDNIAKIYDAYASYLSGSKLKNWSQVYLYSTENKLAGQDYVMYKLANILSAPDSLSMYEELIQKYPKSDYAPESMWQVFWNKYKSRDYEAALQIGEKHLRLFDKVKPTPRMLFWMAKIYLKENKISEAHTYLSKLTSKYSDDYYGLRAESILDKKSDFWKTGTEKIPAKNQEVEFPIITSNLDMKDLKLINTLFNMGDYEIWLDADFNNPIVESWFELKKNKKAHSILLAREELDKMEIKPPVISTVYKLAYPRYYVDEINSLSSANNLDSFFVISLVREESYFNDMAKSSKNALGLMQLMPETAKYIISKFQININSIDGIEDINTNLLLGCTYLKYLKERFDNDVFVVAAYNGGEGSVSKWLKIYRKDDLDEFIENIPLLETKNYVQKVFRSYHMYKKIYK